ncbi:MAG: hypothetical protein A3E01_19495 [Gammaproteobacteria bacterium RIFCSPHIGHO2_12_FULL_63_22]|nr:MAG: hypothetical protein A3E01_19495 [Gammaproteobacteria bacterium RIFCSPHIGHO2_12_FULL_63_22]
MHQLAFALLTTLLSTAAMATAAASAPESKPPHAKAKPVWQESFSDADWRLAWNSKRDGKWHIYQLDAAGSPVNLTRHVFDDWLWSTRDGQLFALTTERKEDEPRGWRGRRLDASGSPTGAIANEKLSDGFVDCLADGSLCAGEVVIEKKKRIALFNPDGSRRQLLGDGSHDDADPQFSPDGSRLLFRSNRGGSWEIHVGNRDGSDAKAITSHPDNNALPEAAYGGEGPARFSPDGQRITWMRELPGAGNDVWVMDVDGSNPRNLTGDQAGGDGYPSFSPDGRLIAFDSKRSGDNEIYVMDADGGNVRRVTDSPGSDLAAMWVRVPKEAGK